ncbi:Pilin (type 1 fimbria component protein) [Kosakonia oryziphila]|uniref:Pilin (Type 1 fimbria component protein) n=2 Tax=Kosakonia oryziphila TaxID=1005667 RepID=A0A1C4GFK3_9ENTR|nr:Pilin (type 1 fimbria component protein) [Kosakonia oryziphila]
MREGLKEEMKKWNTAQRKYNLNAMIGVVIIIGSGMNPAKAANPPSITATYTVTTQNATCDLQLNTAATLQLEDVRQGSFFDGSSPGRAQGKVITLQLVNCMGSPGGRVPKISVYGDRDGVTDPTLYRKSTSVAEGVGFALTQDNNGTGAVLLAGTSANPTNVQVPGTNIGQDPNNKTIDFFVQASRGNQSASGVTSGTLTTDLHFDFIYE